MGVHKQGSFDTGFVSWNQDLANLKDINWTAQFQMLNEIAELITPELNITDITASIYRNVNNLIDAFQFAVGIYDANKQIITYRGMIESGQVIPDFSVNALAENRFASWCIRHESEIFINNMDAEFSRYLEYKPVPLAGCNPEAALYVPLKLNNKVVGLITVRTIRKHVYQPHHLHMLKTVGNFIVRALELAAISSQPEAREETKQGGLHWRDKKELSIASHRALELLTGREKEVLWLLCTGMSNKAIATHLFVSASTVKTHTINLYQKLEVANRTAAMAKAVEWRWFL